MRFRSKNGTGKPHDPIEYRPAKVGDDPLSDERELIDPHVVEDSLNDQHADQNDPVAVEVARLNVGVRHDGVDEIAHDGREHQTKPGRHQYGERSNDEPGPVRPGETKHGDELSKLRPRIIASHSIRCGGFRPGCGRLTGGTHQGMVGTGMTARRLLVVRLQA